MDLLSQPGRFIMKNIRSRKAHHLSLIPFYVFCLATLVFAIVSHKQQGDSGADTSGGNGPDCEVICGRFAECLAVVYPPEQVKMYAWTIAAGCRNGCAKQRKRLGECFTPGATCPAIQGCIGSKL